MSDAFLSHSWKDKPFAYRLEADLGGRGVAVWVDHSEMQPGQVLIDELQQSIEGARCLALLWSEHASQSRWVKTEWQAAFVLEKTIVPCLLDGTQLPLFLRTLLACDFQVSYDTGLAGLAKVLVPGATPTLPAAPPAPSAPSPVGGPPPPPLPAKGLSWGLRRLVDWFVRRSKAPAPEGPLIQPAEDLLRPIFEGQAEVLAALGGGDLGRAAGPQKRTDALVEKALRRRSQDPEILNLAGYQKKNAYLLCHWTDVQHGTYPPDPLLEEAEDFFHESLSVKPMNPSAWNGLGSVFLLRGDLDAAEFFVKKALERARAEDVNYGAAEEDLQTIARLRDLGG